MALSTPENKEVVNTKKVFANEELCINCRLCEVYCKTAHSKSKDTVKAYKYESPEPVSRIAVSGGRMASVAVNCRHCDDPACVKTCITGAMTKDKKQELSPSTRINVSVV
ncbi:MAG: hypothetical protein LUG95_04655 [Clostridiales bacterium]|nr:hypothetical protein [Clostridiales bacterium]